MPSVGELTQCPIWEASSLLALNVLAFPRLAIVLHADDPVFLAGQRQLHARCKLALRVSTEFLD